MKNEGKNAKHGFKIMTAVITVCAVLCTVFSAMSLVLQYKDHIMLKKYGDFVSYENSTKNADEKDGFYLVTKEAKTEGESDTAANAITGTASALNAMPADSSNILFDPKYSTHRKSLSSNRIAPTASEFYA